jgi:hypothetical protein
VTGPLPFFAAMPTFASSLKTGRRPQPVEENQCGSRNPNEDAVLMPQG